MIAKTKNSKKNEIYQFKSHLVDSILKIVQRPNQKLFLIIFNRICTTYLESFQAFIPRFGFVGKGIDSVVRKMSVCKENKGRNRSTSLKKRSFL